MNRLAMMVLKNIFKVPGLYWKLRRYAKNPDNYPETERYAHIRHILRLAVKSGNVIVDFHGKENIPEDTGYLICGNHQGLFDVVALVSVFDKPMGAVYKTELKDIPFIREIATISKSFPMDREDVRQSLTVIQNVTKELQAGRNYLIFPEGTRSKNGNVMGEFHGGSFRCAVKAKAPILPFAVIDSFQVLDQKGSKPVTMQLHLLKPIPYEEYKDLKTPDLAALVKARIQEAIDANT